MKIVLAIIAIIVLAVGGLLVYVAMNSGALIGQALEQYGPDFLGVTVEVDAVDLSLSDGTGEIRGLTLGNPPGFEGPHSFYIDRAALALDVESIGSDVIVVKSIVLDGAQPAVVVKGLKDTNFEAILDHLESNVGTSSGAGDTASAGDEVKLIVDEFSFTNAVASVDSDVLGDASLEIPDIVLNDIGRKENGVLAAEAVKQMFKPISRAVTEGVVAQHSGLDKIKAGLEDKLEEAKKNPLKLLDKLSK